MRRKKRSVTLIEIMIVILLIGLIGGALAYNMRGSLEEGKAFKTQQNITRIYDILMLEQAVHGTSLAELEKDPAKYLKISDLVKKGEELLKGGWGEAIKVKAQGDELIVSSDKLKAYETKKEQKRK